MLKMSFLLLLLVIFTMALLAIFTFKGAFCDF